VATIVSEYLPSGDYSRQWNAMTMQAVFYFYRLQAGSFTENQKTCFAPDETIAT